MNLSARSLLPLATLASIGHCVAQTVTFEIGSLYLLPVAGITAPAFTSAVAGHLQGHHLNDAVVLANGRPVLVSAPGVHRSAVPLPLPATPPNGYVADDVRDIAVLRNGGEEGRDALVLVTGAGLWRWYKSRQLVVPAGGGAPGMAWVVCLEPLGTSVWAGAKRLRVADVDGDGNDDVLGIMSAERSIRCLLRDGADTTWVIPAAAHVRDFTVVDLVPGGTPEIAAMTGAITGAVPAFSGGLRVFAPGNSTDLARTELAWNTPVCAALHGTNGNGVVVAGHDGVQARVCTFAMVNGALAQCSVIDVAGTVTAIRSAKWQGAHEDVLLTYQHTSNPAVVAHDGALQLGTVRTMLFGSHAMADNRAACLVADWHGDPAEPEAALHGQPLLLYPSTAAGCIVLQQRTAFDDRFVQVTGGTGFAIAAPPDLRPTHVEIEGWRVTATATGVARSATSEREVRALHDDGTEWSIEPRRDNTTQWHLAMRFVSRNSAGEIVRRWPARTAGLAWNPAWIPYFLEGYEDLVQPAPQNANGPGLLTPIPITIIWTGITGDVVQPPGGPGDDGDDDDPPEPDPDGDGDDGSGGGGGGG
jgi:hypothetical protein